MTFLTDISYLFLLLPLAVLIINNLVTKKTSIHWGIPMLSAICAVQFVGACIQFFSLANSDGVVLSFGLLWDETLAGAGYFAVDLISAFYMIVVGLVGFCAMLTAHKTVTSHRQYYTNLVAGLLLGLNGMLLVRDLFSLYVFIEVVGLASFVLIAMFFSKEDLEGAFKYLTMSALSTIMIVTALSFLFMEIGTLSFYGVADILDEVAAGGNVILIRSAMAMFLAGCCIKAGVAPFHGWVPDTYESADDAVAIVLAGAVNKVAGIYGIVILVRIFADMPEFRIALMVLGCLSILTGAFMALRQNNFKRIIAYSSVSQMGYILLGLAAGNVLGLAGAFLHVLNHSLLKGTLFSNAAALRQRLRTLDIREMGGLQKVMPVTGVTSVCAFLSTAGIPPFSGFWSKLLILMGLWTAGVSGVAALALLASIVTAAYFLRLQKHVFFGKLPEKWQQVKEIWNTVSISEVVLTVLNIALGIGFPLILLYAQKLGLL